MTVHILVEGPSERAFFDRWTPRLLPGLSVRVHPHQGKGSLPRAVDAQLSSKARGLLDQLPAKLRGFAAALDPHLDSVVVLVDADDDDVATLAAEIAAVARHCAPRLSVCVSIAVEETEAFYLGDLRALKAAYPAADMVAARAYIPDSICGTWELFDQIVDDGGGNKVAWGEAMGPRVTIQPAQSRSPSFQDLVRQLLSLVPAPPPAKRKRPYRHPSKAQKPGNKRR